MTRRRVLRWQEHDYSATPTDALQRAAAWATAMLNTLDYRDTPTRREWRARRRAMFEELLRRTALHRSLREGAQQAAAGMGADHARRPGVTNGRSRK
jgi:hypothetical protein